MTNEIELKIGIFYLCYDDDRNLVENSISKKHFSLSQLLLLSHYLSR